MIWSSRVRSNFLKAGIPHKNLITALNKETCFQVAFEF